MLANHALLWGSTGKAEMLVFHTLSAGNIWQLGAPGRGEPADAFPGAVTSASPPDAIPASKRIASSALFGSRGCMLRSPTVAQWTRCGRTA